MKRLMVWAVILGVLALAFLVIVLSTAALLPDRVATHFNAAGQPDGWMQRTSYVSFTLCFGLGLAAFVVLLFHLIRFMPDWTINLPNKSYWLSPPQRPVTHTYLALQGFILGCFLLFFFGAMHFLTVLANRTDPVRLSGTGTAVLLCTFIGAIGLWVFGFYRRFR